MHSLDALAAAQPDDLGTGSSADGEPSRPDCASIWWPDPSLCAPRQALSTTVRRAVAGGVTMVQLRDKHSHDRAARCSWRLALQARALALGTGVPVVVNDDVTLPLSQAQVDGAHIGQGDISPAQARALLGPGKILGLSCETAASRAGDADPASGGLPRTWPRVSAPPQKPTMRSPTGLDGLAQLVALSPLPNVAIGGLKS